MQVAGKNLGNPEGETKFPYGGKFEGGGNFLPARRKSSKIKTPIGLYILNNSLFFLIL